MPTNRQDPVVRARLKKKQDWLLEQKSQPCNDCGNTYDPICMDYHHIKPKTYSISLMVNSDWSMKKIQAEMDKCVLICSNCHRLRHKEELYKVAT